VILIAGADFTPQEAFHAFDKKADGGWSPARDHIYEGAPTASSTAASSMEGRMRRRLAPDPGIRSAAQLAPPAVLWVPRALGARVVEAR